MTVDIGLVSTHLSLKLFEGSLQVTDQVFPSRFMAQAQSVWAVNQREKLGLWLTVWTKKTRLVRCL